MLKTNLMQKALASLHVIILALAVCVQSAGAQDITSTTTASTDSNTGLVLNIDNAKVERKRIAVVPFAGNSSSDKIDYIVSVDLKQSGVFSPISPNSYAERPTSSDTIPFETFQSMNVPYLVFGEIADVSGKRSIRFALIDNFQQRVLQSYSVPIHNNDVRFAAHYVSDIILQKITGTRGAFATKLAYIYESGSQSSRRYQLMLSDVDGHNGKSLLKSVAPIMSPRFSPDNKKIAYVSFEGDKSQIVVQNIHDGFRQLVTAEPGINASPAWSPDGTKIAMALSKDGNSEIYFKNLSTGVLTRVTNHSAIDTEPVWSQDGNSLYFTSDRTGSPRLYKINLGTGSVTSVSQNNSYTAGADVSDNGRLVAFTQRQGRDFVVGTYALETAKFTPVSRGHFDETPRFSPNAQMLIYTSIKNGQQVLKIVNIDGTDENILSGSGNIRDADWSHFEPIQK